MRSGVRVMERGALLEQQHSRVTWKAKHAGAEPGALGEVVEKN